MRTRNTCVVFAALSLAWACGGPPKEAAPESAPAGLTEHADWHPWAPRPENAALLTVEREGGRSPEGALVVSGNGNRAVLGGWERTVEGIEPGQWYRLSLLYRHEGLALATRQVVCRLDWARADGRRAGRPEYAWREEPEGDWTRLTVEAPAPEDAAAVRIQLLLWDAPEGKVGFDEVKLEPVPAPQPRPVRIASVNYRPQRTASAGESVRRFIELVDREVRDEVDLILLPEGITVVGTGKKYAEVAEPVPGPTTERLGELARRHKAYVVAGLYELERPALYNTAVLIGRDGGFIGKYRKVYIPREETEGGISPGWSYPVFETDFGKLGMMICWDTQYADPARGLTLGGAEIIAVPIWGGNETLVKARAIENQVYLVTSGYDFPARVYTPDGEIVAAAAKDGEVVRATVDLNRRWVYPWLGEMRGRFRRELRLDVPVAPQ